MKYAEIKAIEKPWDFPVKKAWKKDEEIICEKCFNICRGYGPYDLHGDYVCDDCYQSYISWCDQLADEREGK